MKYYKIFQYAYLVLAALFIYDAIDKYTVNGELSYTSVLFAALAVFMFSENDSIKSLRMAIILNK